MKKLFIFQFFLFRSTHSSLFNCPLTSTRSEERRVEDGIKEILRKANDNWNDWKFQIRWNKLEWVDLKRENWKINNFSHHN